MVHNKTWFVLSINLLLGLEQSYGQDVKPINFRLAHFIDSLDRIDQLPYQQLVRGEIPGDSAKAQSNRIYRQNCQHLKRIIRAHGYPSFALVGPEATEHFNNMVFHCAFDPSFQKQALRLFTRQGRRQPSLRTDKRYLHDVAYLTDKVTHPQVYGTQISANKTGAFLLPTIDILQLDERRKRMQLEPIADYLTKATALNRQMNPKFMALGQFNSALKRELDSLYALHRLYRSVLLDKTKTRERDSIILAQHYSAQQAKESFEQLMIQTDSSNIARVKLLIQQFGYPGKTLVGTPTNEVAFHIIQTSTLTKKYLPLIEQVAQQGEVSFQLYALMLDRQLMREQKAQVYGTQGRGYPVVSGTTGKTEWKWLIWPIANASHVNKRRQMAGFSQTVQENARRLGIIYKAVRLKKMKHLPRCGDLN